MLLCLQNWILFRNGLIQIQKRRCCRSNTCSGRLSVVSGRLLSLLFKKRSYSGSPGRAGILLPNMSCDADVTEPLNSIGSPVEKGRDIEMPLSLVVSC